MHIRYLGTSGFEMLVGNDLLIVDCFQKEPISDLRGFEKILVLATHGHPDHFSMNVFDWLKKNPRIEYVLSSDIQVLSDGRVPAMAHINYISPGQHLVTSGAQIRAFGSTDVGCSFAVWWYDKLLFHAGDLNLWDWKNEGDAVFVREAEEAFGKILAEVAGHIHEPDVAFFPVDPRMAIDYYRGAVMFAEAVRPKLFVPMHFGHTFNPPASFYPEMEPYTQIASVKKRGDEFEAPGQ
ncbi:MAG: MBL fold metallo-hydrolase [Peptococcaceae bacterium]|nr:MBL fold metallo-hydrolase [Peptococcaceae bacterium]